VITLDNLAKIKYHNIFSKLYIYITYNFPVTYKILHCRAFDFP